MNNRIFVNFLFVIICLCFLEEDPKLKPYVSQNKRFLTITEPTQGCPTFLVVTTTTGGLGHRLVALAIAISFLIRYNSSATLLLDSNYFSQARGYGGESYDFAVKILGLDLFLDTTDVGISFLDGSNVANKNSFEAPMFQTRWGVVRPKSFESVEDAVLGTTSSCGVVALLPCGYLGMCRHSDGTPTWCFESEHADIASARFFFSNLLSGHNIQHFNGDSKCLNGDSKCLNVVWHIRNDDMILIADGADAISLVIEAVSNSLRSSISSARHWVVAQNPITPDDRSFGIFHNYPGLDAAFLTSLSTMEAFLHLVNADILVHTGSTFAVSAALLAHESQVFLYGKPKESIHFGDPAWHVQYIPNCIPVQPGGIILPDDSLRLNMRIESRINYRWKGHL